MLDFESIVTLNVLDLEGIAFAVRTAFAMQNQSLHRKYFSPSDYQFFENCFKSENRQLLYLSRFDELQYFCKKKHSVPKFLPVHIFSFGAWSQLTFLIFGTIKSTIIALVLLLTMKINFFFQIGWSEIPFC